MTILVCPLHEVESLVAAHRPASVVSLMGPGSEFPKIDGVRRLILAFNDIDAPTEGLVAPTADDVARLLAFFADHPTDRPLLVHCWAGVSRSTAAAYIAACQGEEPGGEDALAARLRAASPSATPNALMIALADAALGRKGAMIRAIAGIGRGAEAAHGRGFRL